VKQYLELLRKIQTDGNYRGDRTGTGTQSIFGYQMRFDLSEGFPLLTTKKVGIDAIIYELLWFLRGDTNIKYLNDNGVHIWDEWADEKGDLGPVYGKQWRGWTYRKNVWDPHLGPDIPTYKIDQMSEVIEQIKTNPESRRLLVSAWNVADLPSMKLSPCHVMFQFYVNNGKLSCQLYQRSADVFLGVPFNIASYALLTMMVAHVTGLVPGEFIHTFGDVHIYNNHQDQVELQLTRNPKSLPKISLSPYIESIFDFEREDIILLDYESHPTIRGEVSV